MLSRGGAGRLHWMGRWSWPWQQKPPLSPILDTDLEASAPRLANELTPQYKLRLELEFSHQQLSQSTGDGESHSRHRLRLQWFWLDPNGTDAVLTGFCSSTAAHCSLHSTTMVDCVEVVSGGAVEDLRALLMEHYATTREGRMERLQQRYGHELTILLYMARADTLLQQREKQLVAGYLAARAPELGFSSDELAPQLRWLNTPSREDFHHALAQIRTLDGERTAELFNTCEAVVDVKATRDGQEQPALDALRAILLG
jgi:hypothetical protein